MLPEAIELSRTSALALLWADNEGYPSRQARQYMKMLDLRGGLELYHTCNKVWPYCDEVVKNRKFAVQSYMDRCAEEMPSPRQVVIVGAGLEPLGIEWKVRHPDDGVFELNSAEMGLKRALLEELADPGAAEIRCLEVDLADAQALADALLDALWRPSRPTLLIVEGLACALAAEELSAVLNLLAESPPTSRAIVEYLLPPEQIAPDRRSVPEGVLNVLAGRFGQRPTPRFSREQLTGHTGWRALDRMTLREMEQRRTGCCDLFPTDASGWLEVALLAP